MLKNVSSNSRPDTCKSCDHCNDSQLTFECRYPLHLCCNTISQWRYQDSLSCTAAHGSFHCRQLPAEHLSPLVRMMNEKDEIDLLKVCNFILAILIRGVAMPHSFTHRFCTNDNDHKQSLDVITLKLKRRYHPTPQWIDVWMCHMGEHNRYWPPWL